MELLIFIYFIFVSGTSILPYNTFMNARQVIHNTLASNKYLTKKNEESIVRDSLIWTEQSILFFLKFFQAKKFGRNTSFYHFSDGFF